MSPQGSAPVALVTGAAVRVGRAITEALAAAGYRVWIHHHHSVEQAQALAHQLGDAAAGVLAADLTDAVQREQLMQSVTAPHGPQRGMLDLLVNNAASFERGPFLDRTDDDLRRVLELNLIAPLALARSFARARQGTDLGAASVINIVDVAGYHPWRGYLDHCVSKAGLLMATRALAVELAPLRVNGVAPGTVAWPESPGYAPQSPARRHIEASIPLGRIGAPSDVAGAVVFLAQSRFVNGHVVAVDGGRLAAAGRGGHDPG